MSQTHAFVRSKLKEAAEVTKLVDKVEGIYAVKSNAFNVYFKSQRFFGETMTSVDFSDPTKISFTSGGVDYEFLLADIQIVQRVRSRKYVFKVNVLTTVV